MSSSCCLLTTPELSVPCIAGHEVFLVAPHSNGRSLHAAVLEGMTHSVVCPTAHRMPSYRCALVSSSLLTTASEQMQC